ncbi:hypothetical protein [Blastococcus sp. SYSU DS0533]
MSEWSETTWAAITSVSTAAAVLVAVLAVRVQAKAVRRSIASQTYQLLVAQFDGLLDQVRTTPGLYRAAFLDSDLNLSATEVERESIDWALARLFNWYESVAVQHQDYGVLPRNIVDHWRELLRQDLQRSAVAHFWALNGHYYHPTLRAWVDEERRPQG